MNEARILLCLCLVLVGAVECYDEPQHHSSSLHVEERAKLSFQGMQNVVGSQDFKRGIPGFIGKIGGITNLIHINYSASPKQVIKAVGDAVVPLIAAGLSLIPGGALIGGLAQGVWSIFSGLFGGPAAKSPMQLMIEDIKDDIKNIKKDLAAFKASLNSTIQKHLDEKLSKLINKAVHGEIRRNEYVCSKYAVLSGHFSYELKNNLPINQSNRADMVAQIHDCDDFLKDTVEAFVYPEYADVLWVPNVITTLVRVAFLTEISNYGLALGIDQKILSLFWSEIKADLQKAFEFYAFAVRKKGDFVSAMGMDERAKFGNFTTADYEGCVMQAQLLYLDGEMYPYGVPQYFRIFSEDSELKIADYNVTGGEEPRHIQVYYNELFRRFRSSTTETLFNCFVGPDRVVRVPHEKLSFRVRYVPNKIYEIRVLYFAEGTSNITLTVDEESENNYVVKIDEGSPSESSVQRFVFRTAFHHMMNVHAFVTNKQGEKILKEVYYYSSQITEGAYVVETALGFTVEPNDETAGKIEINVDDADFVYLFGVELIVQPLVAEH